MGMSDVAGVFQPFPALIADARDPPQKREKHAMELIKIVATPPIALHSPYACFFYSMLNASGVFRPFPASLTMPVSAKWAQCSKTELSQYVHYLLLDEHVHYISLARLPSILACTLPWACTQRSRSASTTSKTRHTSVHNYLHTYASL